MGWCWDSIRSHKYLQRHRKRSGTFVKRGIHDKKCSLTLSTGGVLWIWLLLWSDTRHHYDYLHALMPHYLGEEYTDEVILGGLTIEQQSIGVAEFAEGFDGFDGILGYV